MFQNTVKVNLCVDALIWRNIFFAHTKVVILDNMSYTLQDDIAFMSNIRSQQLKKKKTTLSILNNFWIFK